MHFNGDNQNIPQFHNAPRSVTILLSQCMGCKAPISEKEKTLCAHCRTSEADIYSAKLREVSRAKAGSMNKMMPTLVLTYNSCVLPTRIVQHLPEESYLLAPATL